MRSSSGGHVLFRCAEPTLIAAHQTVGAAVDEDDRIDLQLRHEHAIRLDDRLGAGAVKRINRHLAAVIPKPLAEVFFREVDGAAFGVGSHLDEFRREVPACGRGREVAE